MFEHDTRSISVFTDGANLDSIARLAKDPLIDGITTNPTLMRSSGVTDYMSFCRSAVQYANNKPLSLEVFSDDFAEMRYQALALHQLSASVYVKVPITNSLGVSTLILIADLVERCVPVNITAVMSYRQIDTLAEVLPISSVAYISIFAGRIADTGVDPVDVIKYAVSVFSSHRDVKILWASTREVYNVYQALSSGCHIITAPPSITSKLALRAYDLEAFSLETVQMFKRDSDAAGYTI